MTKFKVGDKVKIKSIDDIRATLGRDDHIIDENGDEALYFNSNMERYCDLTFIIEQAHSDDTYHMENMDWCWHESWLEPGFTPITLDDNLFEV